MQTINTVANQDIEKPAFLRNLLDPKNEPSNSINQISAKSSSSKNHISNELSKVNNENSFLLDEEKVDKTRSLINLFGPLLNGLKIIGGKPILSKVLPTTLKKTQLIKFSTGSDPVTILDCISVFTGAGVIYLAHLITSSEQYGLHAIGLKISNWHFSFKKLFGSRTVLPNQPSALESSNNLENSDDFNDVSFPLHPQKDDENNDEHNVFLPNGFYYPENRLRS